MARAYCPECGQSETGSLEEAGDWAEEHRKKEQHHDVTVERAVADGGAEIPDDQTVYVAAKGLGGGSTVLHTDPDCRSVKSIRNVHERKRGMYPDDTKICGHCQGTTPAPTGGPSDHYRSLKDAAENDVATDGGVREVYFTAQNNAGTRAFHENPDCRQLRQRKRTLRSAPVTHLPRGSLCYYCFDDDTTLEDLQPDTDQVVATDGGRELPELVDWPYDAVIHGADVRAKCLAVTGSGDCCANNAYGDAICGMHQSSNEPDIQVGAHQWARIRDGDFVVAVCVNCEEVWLGGTPALAVDCQDCPASAGERCSDPDSMTGRGMMPHPSRRDDARELVDEYTECEEAPIPAVEDGQQRLVTDGGRIELPDSHLTRYRLDILFAVASASQITQLVSPLTIKSELEDHRGQDISEDVLHDNLDDLVDAGLLDAEELDPQYYGYQLTDDGAQRLRDRVEWTTGCLDLQTADASSAAGYKVVDDD